MPQSQAIYRSKDMGRCTVHVTHVGLAESRVPEAPRK